MNWLDDLHERLRREPSLTPELVVTIVAKEWGGERVYIPRRQTPDIRPNDTPTDVVRRYGVSRRTAYNWVARWRR